MKRTIYIVMGMLVAAAMLLSACGGTPVPTVVVTEPPVVATEPPVVSAPGQTVITIWNQWSGDYLDAISAIFAQYMTEHPDVVITLNKPNDVPASLAVAIPAGAGPDILGWANDKIGTNALNGNIVALDDYGVDLAFLQSNYEPAAVAGVQWNGKIWALPESQEAMTLVYNKALAGPSDFPTDPVDFTAWAAAIQTYYENHLTADGANIPLICNQGFPGGDAYQVAPVYFGFGVPGYVDDQGNTFFNTPEALAAANWFLTVKPFLFQEMSWDICNTGMAEGKVAAWLVGPWGIANLDNAGIDYGFVTFGKPFVGIKTLMLTKNAVDRGNADLALDIMKYYTNAANQKAETLANKTIPANTAAFMDPEVQALVTIAGFGANAALGIPMPSTPYMDAAWVPINDGTASIWNGTQTPEVALPAIQTAIEAAVAAMQ
jgi:arabinogalactan oligomer / maltooligosaccharide transport system substrate-binding protein